MPEVEEPVSVVDVRDFPGLATNLDPDDLRPGTAREQVNVLGSRPALLEVRPGFRVVRWEDS